MVHIALHCPNPLESHPALVMRVRSLDFVPALYQGVFLWTLRVCTLGFWVPEPWNMALNKGIWDPKLRGTNIKGTNLKYLSVWRCGRHFLQEWFECFYSWEYFILGGVFDVSPKP